MDPNQIFSLASTVAMVGWLLLAVAPEWKYTRPVIMKCGIPILLSVAYAFCIFSAMGGDGGMDFSSFGSLEGVMGLFTDPSAVLAGWIHYLAFDLWIGTWEVADAKKHGISRWFLLPCLFFTFMLGPVGLLLYLLLRWALTKKAVHENF